MLVVNRLNITLLSRSKLILKVRFKFIENLLLSLIFVNLLNAYKKIIRCLKRQSLNNKTFKLKLFLSVILTLKIKLQFIV